MAKTEADFMAITFFKKTQDFNIENSMQMERIPTEQYGFADTDFIRDLKSQVATDRDVAIFERYI